jgi:hypothetical protein
MENKQSKICRICGISSDINKFVIKENGKIYGKRCLKCISKINNERLKNKEDGNYYADYYKKNKLKFAIRDRERYLKKKALIELEKLKISETSETENADDIENIDV